MGLEPTRDNARKDLNLVCLPISSPSLYTYKISTGFEKWIKKEEDPN